MNLAPYRERPGDYIIVRGFEKALYTLDYCYGN